MPRKICSKCKLEKDLSEFPIRKSSKDGHRGYCYICKNEGQRNYRKKLTDRQKEIQRSHVRNWFKYNKPHRREYMRTYEKKRRKNDPIHKLKINLRTRISIFVKKRKFNKNDSTFKIIGCTPEQLKKHIEKQFDEKMTWNNYGRFGWHVDHKIPLDSAKNIEELYKLCYYSNLQPLWWEDNLKKSNKINAL